MSDPSPHRPLSLAAGTVLDVEDPVRVVEVAAEAGYASLGLRLSPEHAIHPTGRRISRALARTGLTLLDVEVVRLRSGPDLDEPTRRLADLAGELGAEHLLTVSHEPDPAVTATALDTLAERLAGSPTSPALEFMGFTAVPSLPAAEEIVRRLAPGRIRLVLDVLHLVRSGGPTAATITVAPELIAYGQLCDAPATTLDMDPDALADEARTSRLLPGDGELPLTTFLRSLPARSPVSVEVQSRSLQERFPPTERAARCLAAARASLTAATVG